jgi:predicted ATPase/DNA-binding SARP family transcriptional activator
LVELRVLGPVELVGDDGPVPLPAKQRRLLAALAIHAGTARSADLLIDAIWGSVAPPSAVGLLQVYVSQLRKALPSPVRIGTRGGGYVLELPEGALDAARFERLLGEARSAMADANPALASSLLRRALALWRGSAYGEFAYEEFARTEAERLEELRLACHEERLEAELELGRHGAALAEVQRLAAEQPLRERPRALAMLALYRCGRQTEALDLYATLRDRLRDQLGLEPGVELRELQRKILQHDPTLAAPTTAQPPALTLPAPPNRTLGREHELDELRQLLLRDDVRLLTLSGAGGSGKTRLALELARQLADAYANGAGFVELAPLRDPALVPAAIARTLSIPQTAGEQPTETITSWLQPREFLLVLDNAEHLHEAAPLYVHLLAHAPRLRILVTSRTVLHLSGEHVYPVPPLAPEPAVALFVERAREADPRFQADAAAEEPMRRIGERLDWLPLAIELAAGHVRALTPRELLARLEPRLPLLSGGPRDLPARQQTLRATLEWSYNLLGEDTQRDLRALSVFAGGSTLKAAESVCETTIERLAALLDHNLVQHTTARDGSRYTMLETIREYALERLEETPEADEIRRRHADFFLTVAESANLNPGKLEPGGQHLEIANAEQDNVRAALTWALTRGSIELAFKLVIAMDQFWTSHAGAREGIRWFEALLEHPGAKAIPPNLRAHALRGYGSCFAIAGDIDAAARFWKQSLALFEQLGDEHGRAELLHRLGIVAMWKGNLERARTLVEESQAIHERSDDRWEKVFGLMQTTGTLGAIARDVGEPERASELIEQSAAMSREVAVPWWESGMLAELACLSIGAGRIDEAERRAHDSLVIAEELHDHAGRIFGIGLFATVAAQREELERAGVLWGAIEHEDAVAPLGGWRRHRGTCEARIRDVAGPEFERGRDEGHTLTLDDAVTLALARDDTTEVPAPKSEARVQG